jgi:hypothetical protein
MFGRCSANADSPTSAAVTVGDFLRSRLSALSGRGRTLSPTLESAGN